MDLLPHHPFELLSFERAYFLHQFQNAILFTAVDLQEASKFHNSFVVHTFRHPFQTFVQNAETWELSIGSDTI